MMNQKKKDMEMTSKTLKDMVKIKTIKNMVKMKTIKNLVMMKTIKDMVVKTEMGKKEEKVNITKEDIWEA